MELCQRIQYCKGIPADWSTGVAVFLKEEDNIFELRQQSDVKLLEHAIKLWENVLKKR